MTESSLAGDAPNWETLALELHCPRCGYDLRLLPQPRCPECGLEFQWRELIAAAECRLECPLFEYHWRDRPVRSLLVTFGQALLPWRLWRQTRLVIPPRVGPLLALIPLIVLLRFACQLAMKYASVWHGSWWMATFMGRRLPVALWRGDWISSFKPVVAGIITGALTWLALQLFQQTIGQQRVRQSQMLRVTILSWVALMAWNALASVLVFGLAMVAAWPRPYYGAYAMWGLRGELFVELSSLLLFIIAICTGLRLYLELRRGHLMGLAAIVLAFGLVLTVVVGLTRDYYRYNSNNPALRTARSLWPGLTDGIGDLLVSLG